jgi:hypothetical protein
LHSFLYLELRKIRAVDFGEFGDDGHGLDEAAVPLEGVEVECEGGGGCQAD